MEEARPTTAQIVPNLSVSNGKAAVAFYKEAFGAIELFRIEMGDGDLFAELSIGGARVFVADESHPHKNLSPDTLGGTTVRIDLLSDDPDGMQARAVAARRSCRRRGNPSGPRRGRWSPDGRGSGSVRPQMADREALDQCAPSRMRTAPGVLR